MRDEEKEACALCRVLSVDGKTPEKGWECKCYKIDGNERSSFTGPGFEIDSGTEKKQLWVSGSSPADATNPPTAYVVNPASGEIYKVIYQCTC